MLFLNGLVPSANNNVVPGGWYTGTLAVIWIIYPIICKASEKCNNKSVFFSWLIVLCCICGVVVGVVCNVDTVARNSFWYFSFINQLPCILIGMIVAEKKDKCISPILATMLFVVAIIIFMMRIPFGAIFTPVLVSLCVGTIYLNTPGCIPKLITSQFLHILNGPEETRCMYIYPIFCWCGI